MTASYRSNRSNRSVNLMIHLSTYVYTSNQIHTLTNYYSLQYKIGSLHSGMKGFFIFFIILFRTLLISIQKIKRNAIITKLHYFSCLVLFSNDYNVKGEMIQNALLSLLFLF